MGKNKSRKKGSNKDGSVFKLAGAKVAKSKLKSAKPVTTNLKKIKFQMKAKQEHADVEFKKTFPDVVKKEAAKKSPSFQRGKSSTNAVVHSGPADMERAAELFEKL